MQLIWSKKFKLIQIKKYTLTIFLCILYLNTVSLTFWWNTYFFYEKRLNRNRNWTTLPFFCHLSVFVILTEQLVYICFFAFYFEHIRKRAFLFVLFANLILIFHFPDNHSTVLGCLHASFLRGPSFHILHMSFYISLSFLCSYIGFFMFIWFIGIV